MPVLEHTDGPSLADGHAESFIFQRNPYGPGTIEARRPTGADRYDIQVVGLSHGSTTIPTSFYDKDVLVVPREHPHWEVWLPEIDAGITPLSAQPRSTVGRRIEHIQRITAWSDQRLAAAFPGGVNRETVNRWRNRPDTNMRPGNLYRLGILHELAQRLDAAGIDAPVWLGTPVVDGTDTPYDLICRGRLADVRRAVDSVASGAAAATEPMRMPPMYSEWDNVVEEAGDDDSGWSWSESDGDGG